MSENAATKLEGFEQFFDEKMHHMAALNEFAEVRGFDFYRVLRNFLLEAVGDEEIDFLKLKEVVDFFIEFEIVDQSYVYNAFLSLELAQKGALPREFYIKILDENVIPSSQFQSSIPFYQSVGALFVFLINKLENGPANTAKKIIASAFGVSDKAIRDKYYNLKEKAEKIPESPEFAAITFLLLFVAICQRQVNWETELKKAKKSPLSQKAYEDVFVRYHSIRQYVAFNTTQALKEVLEENPPLIQWLLGEEKRELLLGYEEQNQLHFDDNSVFYVLLISMLAHFFPNKIQSEEFIEKLKGLSTTP